MLFTILLILFIILAFGGLFYRPLGNGYYGYIPSMFFLLVVLILVFYLLGVL
jgi:hypothetical protein